MPRSSVNLPLPALAAARAVATEMVALRRPPGMVTVPPPKSVNCGGVAPAAVMVYGTVTASGESCVEATVKIAVSPSLTVLRAAVTPTPWKSFSRKNKVEGLCDTLTWPADSAVTGNAM